MLSLEALNVFYQDSQILWDVSLEVPPGQIFCLMGRNGVGKTTLLKTVMGLLRPRSGAMAFEGSALTGLPPAERARRGIGYVPQGREIFPALTVEENLRIGLVARGRSGGEIPEGVLRLFPALAGMLRRKGGYLSGGQQQQLAIARALVPGPKLLILDEPTEGIQPSIIQEIKEVLRRIRREGRLSVLLVEQYLEFVRDLGDRFAIMEKGSIVAEGEMNDLKDSMVRKHLAV